MKKKWMGPALLACAAAFAIPGLDNRLRVREYRIETGKIPAPLRLCLITDLHSCKYGEEQEELVSAVAGQKPDLLLLSGDIFDDILPDKNAEIFLRRASLLCPVYYAAGNHEFRGGEKAFRKKMEILDRCGVRRLSAEAETVCGVNIAGVDDPNACKLDQSYSFQKQLAQVREITRNGLYTVLLSHRPELFSFYQGFDLVLCGHAHGGQWRVPGILNGLYAPHQGLFPRYAGGTYQKGETTMIVSRGLARESTPVPRFYNPPEIVTIELQ